MADRLLFPPTTVADMRQRGWDAPDFVYVSGDAYVDHPSFGAAVIVRTLEAAGYHVAVLAQPNWKNANDFKRFGRPNYGFLVSSGVIDSMVNHYTAAKRRRSSDVYTPGGKAAKRPDRAVNVYCRLIREAYGDIPIAIGGVEASLRRFAHYDYWDDAVRPSILVDSGADLLMFGMGERTILVTADWMSRGAPVWECAKMRGVCFLSPAAMRASIEIPSYEDCVRSKKKYGEAFLVQYNEQDPIRGHAISQRHGDQYVVQTVPDMPLSREELDQSYTLPYQRTWHPDYDALGGVPAIEEVQFSIAHTRGCFGSCSFCAITFLQGRIVTTRSHESVVNEAKAITQMPNFKGYIHDVGGPTANFRRAACDKQLKRRHLRGAAVPVPQALPEYGRRSHGLHQPAARNSALCRRSKRCSCVPVCAIDYMHGGSFRRIPAASCAQYHVSGQLKVAPEHVSPKVLARHGQTGARRIRRILRKIQAHQSAAGQGAVSCALSDFKPPRQRPCTPPSSWPNTCAISTISPSRCRISTPRPGTLSTVHVLYRLRSAHDGKPVYMPDVRRRKRPCSARCSSSAVHRILISSAKPCVRRTARI